MSEMADHLGRPARSIVRHVAESLPHWCRVVMERDIDRQLRELPIGTLDAIEISGHRRGRLGFRSYRSTSYPEFDVCTTEAFEPIADVVFCERGSRSIGLLPGAIARV